jgi:small subunit ribosomal protein S16
MSVHIRLARHGSKKVAFYRVVVTDQRCPRDGRFIENLGTFDPAQESARALQVNRERLEHWRQRGARPSHTLERLLKRSSDTRTSAAQD